MKKSYKFPLLLILGLLGSGVGIDAQTEDTLVVEMLYKADTPELDNTVFIDRATVFKFGEVYQPSVPLDMFTNLEYTIDDTFGDLRSKGKFIFDRVKLKEMEGKFPVNVMLNGKETKGFIRIPYKSSMRFNFYTDKIKPVLNFWINVEAKYEGGQVMPMSADELIITTSYGEIEGLELILPEEPEVDEVTIRACLVSDPDVCIEQTVPIMKQDARGYWEDEDEYDPEKVYDESAPSEEGSTNIPGYERKQYYNPDADDVPAEEETIDDEEKTDEEETKENGESSETEKPVYDSKWDYIYQKLKKKKS